MLPFLSGLQRLFCFHGPRRPQGSQTDFSADKVLARSILFSLDRAFNEFPVISLSTPSTFIVCEFGTLCSFWTVPPGFFVFIFSLWASAFHWNHLLQVLYVNSSEIFLMFGLTMPLDCTSYFLRFRFDVSFFIFVLFSFVDLILTHLSCFVNTFF